MYNNISKIKAFLTNGMSKTFDICEFEYFASVNELEHKKENIIINLSQRSKSFVYEIDENGEIINKDFIPSVVFVKDYSVV